MLATEPIVFFFSVSLNSFTPIAHQLTTIDSSGLVRLSLRRVNPAAAHFETAVAWGVLWLTVSSLVA